jgi:corrinoid protein of di/trimethylamine methyltransferase
MSEQALFEKLAKAVMDGDISTVEITSKEAVKAGIDPIRVIKEGLSEGIMKVGADFANGTVFLPELLISAEAMKNGMNILLPEIKKQGGDTARAFVGKAIVGTVAGDIHSIGKTLVGAMMTAASFDVLDLGEDVPVETFIEKVIELRPRIVGLSALLTTTMVKQRDVIEVLKRDGLREKVKVMVGGAPVDAAWAQEIGADAYGTDAMDAVVKAKRLINEKQ